MWPRQDENDRLYQTNCRWLKAVVVAADQDGNGTCNLGRIILIHTNDYVLASHHETGKEQTSGWKVYGLAGNP